MYVKNGVKFGSETTSALRIREFIPEKKNPLSDLKREVISELGKYVGEDAAEIKAMLNEKRQAGELTEILLKETLKKIKNAA